MFGVDDSRNSSDKKGTLWGEESETRKQFRYGSIVTGKSSFIKRYYSNLRRTVLTAGAVIIGLMLLFIFTYSPIYGTWERQTEGNVTFMFSRHTFKRTEIKTFFSYSTWQEETEINERTGRYSISKDSDGKKIELLYDDGATLVATLQQTRNTLGISTNLYKKTEGTDYISISILIATGFISFGLAYIVIYAIKEKEKIRRTSTMPSSSGLSKYLSTGAVKDSISSTQAITVPDTGMVNCNACKTPNPMTSKFCKSCGGKLHAECPNCHNPIENDARFCGECGTRFKPPEEIL